MTATPLHLELAGEPWKLEVPERWRPRVDIAFGHLAGAAVAEPRVRVSLRCSASAEERRWATALVAKLPEADGIAAIDNEEGWVHVSRVSIDRWDQRAGSGESTLLDLRYEENYLGTNILLRQIVWRAHERGLVPVHAAAVGGDGGFWLIPAAAGQGKSTLAAAAVAAGLQALSDDFLLLDPQTRILHSLYATIRLEPAAHRMVSEHFGEGRLRIAAQRDDDKLLLAAADASAFVAGGRLRGILILNRVGKIRMGEAVAPARALQSFASSLRLLPSLGFPAAAAFRHFSELSRSVECRVLETGPDLTRLVDCLRNHAGCAV